MGLVQLVNFLVFLTYMIFWLLALCHFGVLLLQVLVHLPNLPIRFIVHLLTHFICLLIPPSNLFIVWRTLFSIASFYMLVHLVDLLVHFLCLQIQLDY